MGPLSVVSGPLHFVQAGYQGDNGPLTTDNGRRTDMAFFSKTIDKLKGALRKTRDIMLTDVRTLFIPGRQINEQFLTEMEERFLAADIGVRNTEKIVGEVRE